jgi:sugar-phosphatase
VLAGRTFAAVLFDMDGTLIDSHPAVERSWLRWAGEYGVSMSSFEGMHGRPAKEIVAAFLPEPRQAEAFRRIEALEVEDTEGIVVLPGTMAALNALPPERKAIATSCTAPLAEARIRAARLPAPGVLVTADQVHAGKPDPAPFLLAAARLGFSATECLVVEDAPAGLTAGRAAGAATLAVTVTHPVEQLDADAVVATLADVEFVSTAAGVQVRPARRPSANRGRSVGPAR